MLAAGPPPIPGAVEGVVAPAETGLDKTETCAAILGLVDEDVAGAEAVTFSDGLSVGKALAAGIWCT